MLLAQTPAMGWNSWNHFHCGVTADLLAETADRIVALGLAKAGYEYVNSDDCWCQLGRDNRTGRMQASEQAFPGGDVAMRNLSSYIHAKGLKFGLCACCQ